MSDKVQQTKTHEVECEHVAKKFSLIHHALGIGNTRILLCRACWGEIVVQVIDDLKDVRIKVR